MNKPNRAVIDTAVLGDNTIIAGTPGLKIRIVKLILVVNAAVSITLKSASTSLTGAMAYAANGGLALDGDVNPLDLNTGDAFVMNLGGAVQVSGFVLYLLE